MKALMLLTSLGSTFVATANNAITDPRYDLMRIPIQSGYDVTDHIRVFIHANGHIDLLPTNTQFDIDIKDQSLVDQPPIDYPDLHSNHWTKEWKSSDLPLFCRAEHLIQKQSGIAFRFRLGSVDYVNALEGK